jgi:hypothetical protein
LELRAITCCSGTRITNKRSDNDDVKRHQTMRKKNLTNTFLLSYGLGVLFLFLPSEIISQVKQMVVYGDIRIEGKLPPEGTQVRILRADSVEGATAVFNPDTIYFGTDTVHFASNIFSTSGFPEGGQILFRIVFPTGDSIIARTTPDRVLFTGLAPPYPPPAIRVNLWNNHPPTFKSMPDTNAYEDSTYLYNVLTIDPEKDSLTFRLRVAPSWLHVDAKTGTVSGIPGKAHVGDTLVTIEAKDRYFRGTNYQTFSLHVHHSNHAPRATTLAFPSNGSSVRLWAEDSSLQFSWHSSIDPDTEDTLRYLFVLNGPGIDTITAALKDTTARIPMSRLKVDTVYNWTVKVSDGSTVVASPDTFLFRTSKATGIDLPNQMASHKSYALNQNYPNPFNPSTTIRFGLAARSRVRLTVFNILGQQVAELVNGVMEPGYATRNWSATVASGLYFCRIEAISVENPDVRFVDVKKMLLVK